MLIGLASIGMGALLLWIGWRHWRLRYRETVSIIEAAILRAGGEEPLPLTRFDRVFGRVRAVLGLVLGLFFGAAGVAILLA